jgi:hypothetical protein
MEIFLSKNPLHPELLVNEVFLTNHPGNIPRDKINTLFESARFGEFAYSKYGVIMKGFLPVFISIEEYIGYQKQSKG